MAADHRSFHVFCRHPGRPCDGSPWIARNPNAAIEAARAHADITGHPADAVLIERTTLCRAHPEPTRRGARRD